MVAAAFNFFAIPCMVDTVSEAALRFTYLFLKTNSANQ